MQNQTERRKWIAIIAVVPGVICVIEGDEDEDETRHESHEINGIFALDNMFINKIGISISTRIIRDLRNIIDTNLMKRRLIQLLHILC